MPRLSATVQLLLSLSLILLTAGAQSASQRSYERARRALDASIQAHGGLAALRGIRDLTLRETGQHRYLHQSPSVEPPFLTNPRAETTVVDFERGRLLTELKISDPSYYVSDSATIINGNTGYTLDKWSKEFAPLPNASLANYRNHFLQRLPHHTLLEALERAASLRWLGEADYRGRKQEVITFVGADGRQTSLNFDAQTKLLTKIDFLYTDSVVGDSLFEIGFSGYRSLDGLKMPTGRSVQIAGEWQVQTEYVELKVNSQPPASLFEPPKDFAQAPALATQPSTVTRLAQDVYLARNVEGGANALFIAFDDYLLAVDAPQARLTVGGGERHIAKIKETVPGKPIRYLVLTNHSYDHAAGVRGFIAEGATVVTTPGNRRFIEKLAAAPFTITPDALAQRPRAPVLETIRNKKQVFRDAHHLVELYDIGPGPTLNEAVVVYLPKEKLLYQTDLFNPGYVRTVIPAQVATVHLAEKLRQLGLAVEQIAGGHGGLTTAAELQTALEKRRQMALK